MEKINSDNFCNMKNIPFFVYGTLMKNFSNHYHIFKNITNMEIKKGELEQACLYHFDMGFPGVYELKEENKTVKGELIFLNKINEEN